MNKKQKDKITALYQQCLKAYEKYKEAAPSRLNNMPVPSVFTDEYTVPSELLFTELCRYDSSWNANHDLFESKLLEYQYQGLNFDPDIFCALKKTQKKQYQVFVELYYRTEGARPFPNKLQVSNVLLETTSKQSLAKVDKQYIFQEENRRSETKNKYLGPVPSIKDRHKSYLEKNIHPIKATLYSNNAFLAVQEAVEVLNLVSDCLHVSQIRGTFSCRFLGGNSSKATEKIVLSNTGIYFVINDNIIEKFYSSA